MMHHAHMHMNLIIIRQCLHVSPTVVIEKRGLHAECLQCICIRFYDVMVQPLYVYCVAHLCIGVAHYMLSLFLKQQPKARQARLVQPT